MGESWRFWQPFEANWSTDEGVIVENVQWPTPITIPYPPLMTYGYEGDIVFPFQVFRSQETELKTISVDFNFLICADICIPESASLSLDLSSASPSEILDTQINNLPTKTINTNSSIEGDNLVISFQSIESFRMHIYFRVKVEIFSIQKINYLNKSMLPTIKFQYLY